jgi:CRISPR/Cas system-associated exonuclease Cas4 (RecB family)
MLANEVIQLHPSHEIIDASKLTTYCDCPRKFFYEYVLGWRPDYPNNHLVFGSAWHVAVEHLLRNAYSSESIDEAKLLFLAHYRKDLPPETDELYAPKRPLDALRALDYYVDRFRDDAYKYEVLHTEIGGSVLIADNAPMWFKIDAMLREHTSGQIVLLDHKTSQRKSSKWSSEWQLSTQILLYLHVLYCLYGTDDVKQAIVRGTFFYKAQPPQFDQAYLRKTNDLMQAWATSTNKWYEDLRHDLDVLWRECTTDSTVMEAFPQNPNACNKYYGCPYLDYCSAWANPLRKCDEPPLGFKREYWSPVELDTIREKVDLTQGV